jgi:hypothetical protein
MPDAFQTAERAGERTLALMKALRQLQREHGVETVTAVQPLLGAEDFKVTIRWSGDVLEVACNDGTWLPLDGSEFL